jgi:hypothetical protein
MRRPELSAMAFFHHDFYLFSARGYYVSKCANPSCPTAFRYLHEGKLFQFEMRSVSNHSADPPNVNSEKKPLCGADCFWLCAPCSSALTLIFDPRRGITVVPLSAARDVQIRPTVPLGDQNEAGMLNPKRLLGQVLFGNGPGRPVDDPA